MRRDAGFTIVESLVALLLLTVGVLALVGTGWRVRALLDRGARATAAAEFAVRRLELLRPLACLEGRSAGSETLQRAGARLATTSWSFQSRGRATVIRVITAYLPRAGQPRSDTLETAVACAA